MLRERFNLHMPKDTSLYDWVLLVALGTPGLVAGDEDMAEGELANLLTRCSSAEEDYPLKKIMFFVLLDLKSIFVM